MLFNSVFIAKGDMVWLLDILEGAKHNRPRSKMQDKEQTSQVGVWHGD